MNRIILDLCGGTGAWSKLYRDAGYNVTVLDLNEPDEFMDVFAAPFGDISLLEKFPGTVHGILCAPPCTMFSIAGNAWKRTDDQMKEALRVVDACLRIVWVNQPVWWCLENPVGKLRRFLGDPVMLFNPCDFGDAYTKKTLLWGNFNIPKKNPTNPIKVFRGSYSQDRYNESIGIRGKKNRSRARSVTPPGFAKAFFESNP